MEPLFQNRYVRDKDTAKALYGYLVFRRPISIVMHCLQAFIFLLFLTNWILRKDTTFFLLLFLVVLYYLMRILLYFNMTKNLLKRDKELNKGMPVEVQVDVTEEGIIGRTATSVNEIPYTSIKKVYRTKKMFLLQTNAKLVIDLPVATFTKGTAEDFAAYLRGKGYKVK